ncbi:MAG TPA: adenylate/guanylate cyclase domain-containing protein [Solimonas sp.]|nr:adenylate/guanylate cyclase domain-containing protein [Solimonas sp.]
MAWALVLALAALVVIALGWRRQRGVSGALRAQLDALSRELERLQRACARLAPAGLVQQIASGDAEAGAERKVVTALFADLMGYTALSEKLDAPVLARVLNGYFERVADAVVDHRGHVSTFLGDGVLAYFGALEPNPWQCNDAAHAALAIRAAIAAYSRELVAEGLPPIGVGVGIHRGPGLAGLLGSRDRREYMVIGRTVNLAARVQALTREHRVDLLLTDEVREELDARFALQPMPARAVKGIAEPVVTYALQEFAA